MWGTTPIAHRSLLLPLTWWYRPLPVREAGYRIPITDVFSLAADIWLSQEAGAKARATAWLLLVWPTTTTQELLGNRPRPTGEDQVPHFHKVYRRCIHILKFEKRQTGVQVSHPPGPSSSLQLNKRKQRFIPRIPRLLCLSHPDIAQAH